MFSFGAPLKPEQFFDRKEELALVERRLLGIKKRVRNDVVLIGPRRVGKSSMLYYLAHSLEKKGVEAIQVDCEGLDLVSFLKAYGNAVVEGELRRKGIAARLREAFKRGVSESVSALAEALGALKAVEMSYSVDFLRFRLEFEKAATAKAVSRQELGELFARTIELPEKTSGFKAILFDEFQETRNYAVASKGDFYARTRALTQKHAKTAYVYTGSAIGLVEEIFSNPKNPFAGNAEAVYVNPFDEKTSTEFLEKNFKSHGKKIESEASNFIYFETGGFPAYLNWVGLKCLDIAGKSGVVNEKTASRACDEMLSPLSPLRQMIEKQFSSLGASTLKVLRAMALGSAVAAEIGRESGVSNVHVYLTRLQQYGLVKSAGDKYEIIDPLLKKFLAT